MDYERAIVEQLACLRQPPPSLEEVRAREVESRRAWEQDTEQIVQTLPEILRDSYRLGRWMQWAGYTLMARASWAAENAGAPEPSRATWARAHRLLEYAEIVMGAAMHWRIRQAELATPRFILRDGKLEMPEPDPLSQAPPPPPARPLTLQRIAEALTQHRRGVPRMLLVVAGAADERAFRHPPGFTVETSGKAGDVFRKALAEAERAIIEAMTGRGDPR